MLEISDAQTLEIAVFLRNLFITEDEYAALGLFYFATDKYWEWIKPLRTKTPVWYGTNDFLHAPSIGHPSHPTTPPSFTQWGDGQPLAGTRDRLPIYGVIDFPCGMMSSTGEWIVHDCVNPKRSGPLLIELNSFDPVEELAPICNSTLCTCDATLLTCREFGLVRVPNINSFPQVSYAELNDGAITAVHNGDFGVEGDFTDLHVLILNGNKISLIEPHALVHLPLRHLEIARNFLTAFPDGLPSSLELLDLRENFITELRAEAIGFLPQLTSLTMSTNKLQLVTLRAFSGHLTLDDNPCLCTHFDTQVACATSDCSGSTAETSSSDSSLLVFAVAVVAVLVLLVVLLVFVQRRSRARRALKPAGMAINEFGEMRSMRERVMLQMQLLYGDLCARQGEAALADRELERGDVRLGRILGTGNFGVVYSGRLDGEAVAHAWTGHGNDGADDDTSDSVVAVKKLPASAGPELAFAFWLEARLMGMLRHPHIVHCYGYVLESAPLLLVMELYSGGSLLSHVRERGKTHEPATQHGISASSIAGVGEQIASACEYLASVKIVHRDLAARNVLVSADGLSRVALGDFGGARHLPEQATYYRQQGLTAVPVRWMSPEALLEAKWTTASDVWAFGVLLWEAASLGERPYRELQNEEVTRFLLQGKRLARPVLCTDEMFLVLQACWAADPSSRPSFSELRAKFQRAQANASPTLAAAGALRPALTFRSQNQDADEEESAL
eukprot:m.269845 g.269845  ORF g.269845 m.269845 type:complete len:730 (-) comp11082_c0_seq13:358-2547(-)